MMVGCWSPGLAFLLVGLAGDRSRDSGQGIQFRQHADRCGRNRRLAPAVILLGALDSRPGTEDHRAALGSGAVGAARAGIHGVRQPQTAAADGAVLAAPAIWTPAAPGRPRNRRATAAAPMARADRRPPAAGARAAAGGRAGRQAAAQPAVFLVVAEGARARRGGARPAADADCMPRHCRRRNRPRRRQRHSTMPGRNRERARAMRRCRARRPATPSTPAEPAPRRGPTAAADAADRRIAAGHGAEIGRRRWHGLFAVFRRLDRGADARRHDAVRVRSTNCARISTSVLERRLELCDAERSKTNKAPVVLVRLRVIRSYSTSSGRFR